MAAAILILALLLSGDSPNVVESRVEWIELNHYGCVEWDKEAEKWRAREILVQVVFWSGPGRRECVAWRMLDKVRFVSEGKGVTVIWQDGEILRKVRAGFVLETWTDADPEVLNREMCPVELRRGLGSVSPEATYKSLRQMRAKER